MQATITILCVVCLIGCSVPAQKKAGDTALRKKIRNNHTKIQDDLKQQAPVETHESVYIGNKKMKLKKKRSLPDFFSKRIVLNAEPRKLPQVINKVSKLSGIPIRLSERLQYQEKRKSGEADDKEKAYTHQIQKSSKMPLKYQGSLKGLLDAVASYYGAYWEWKEQNVYFYRLKTKTYNLITSPGEIKTESQISNESQAGSSTNTGDSGGKNNIEGYQKAKYNYVFNIWEKTVENMKTIISDSGKVVANPSSGTVTITDTPPVHQEVKDYIDQVNEKLSRQVAISAKVYSFTLSDAQNYGYSLKAVFRDMNEQFSASLSSANPLELLDGTGSLSAAILNRGDVDQENIDPKHHQWGGSEAVIRALDQKGNVSLVTSGSGIAMNNQPLPIQNVRRQGYLKESTTSTTGDTTRTTLQSGSLTTGFALSATPHILKNNKVVLQYNISLSSLENMDVIESGNSKIQTPETSSRNFMQQVTLEMGETLFLAGFHREKNQFDHSNSGAGLFGYQKKGESEQKMILVSLTVNEVS
jgi:type IVB pilus formation R64 PilN family outer membrane protein